MGTPKWTWSLGIESEAKGHTGAETETGGQTEGEAGAETETEVDAEVETETEVETSAGANAEPETGGGDAETDAESDAGTEAEAEAGTNIGIEVEVGAKTKTDANAEVGAETETEAEVGAEAGGENTVGDENDTKEKGPHRTTVSVEALSPEAKATLETRIRGLLISKIQLEGDDESGVFIIKGKLDSKTVKVELDGDGEIVGKVQGDVDDDPLNGCTRGSGYWKNHLEASAWAAIDPQASLFFSGLTHLEVLTEPSRGDAYRILARTYVSASLNEANGAGPSAEVQLALDAAFEWLQANEPGHSRSSAEGETAIELAGILDAYNRCIIGASSCDGESEAPAKEDEPGAEEGDAGENDPGNNEDPGDPGEDTQPVTPVTVDLRVLPVEARASGLLGTVQLEIETESGVTYRFECLNSAHRWQPLGGKFKGDGNRKVVRVLIGRKQHCTMYRLRTTASASATHEGGGESDSGEIEGKAEGEAQSDLDAEGETNGEAEGESRSTFDLAGSLIN